MAPRSRANPRTQAGRLSAVATPDDAFRVGIDHLAEEALECRDIRHPWYVSSDYRRVTTEEAGVHPRQGLHEYVERRLTCARCGTVRKEAYMIIESPGWSALRSLGVSYDYPDDYLLKGLPPGINNASEIIRGLRYARSLGSAKTGKRKSSRAS